MNIKMIIASLGIILFTSLAHSEIISNATLNDTIEHLRTTPPLQVMGVIELTGVTSKVYQIPSTIIFRYKVAIDTTTFNKEQTEITVAKYSPIIHKRMCSIAEIKRLLENEFTIVNVFVDSKEAYIGDTMTTKLICQSPLLNSNPFLIDM